MLGKLLQNIISYEITRIVEFLVSDSPQVIADWFVSPLLKSLGETESIDELRVILYEKDGSTGYFKFSSQMRPELQEFRICGAKNGLALGQDEETLIKLSGARFPSYAATFVPNVTTAFQYLGNLSTNLGRPFGERFPHEVGNEVFDRVFLPIDR